MVIYQSNLEEIVKNIHSCTIIVFICNHDLEIRLCFTNFFNKALFRIILRILFGNQCSRYYKEESLL